MLTIKCLLSALMLIVVIIILYLLVSNRALETPDITRSEASKIATDYFYQKYGLDVEYMFFREERVAEQEYLNHIYVKDGEQEYELYLDHENKPMCDNKEVLREIEEFDVKYLEEMLAPMGLILDEYSLNNFYDNSKKQFFFYVSVDTHNLMSYEQKDELYSILQELAGLGVDRFSISLKTPEFFMPKTDIGYDVHEISLCSALFYTDISEREFEKKYKSFLNKFYYDEEKLTEIINYLNNNGFENTFFFMPNFKDAGHVELALHCESDDPNAIEIAKEQLLKVDDSYFKLEGRETRLSLDIVTNGNRQFIICN